ncbi:MAG: DNA polymerase IV [Tannerellaceae bacterium]|jgi:DNA polymerase-4|nr:DNA polymerase IV [Tannerellaceae bacterium]
MVRKIIHVDMDAFYASIEQRDFPEYRNRPLAVGHSEARGVVAAASYEARRYGVRSAMPAKTALRKCPHIIFVPPRFEAYKEVSGQIMDIFLEYTSIVEPLSLDEAFLDVTANLKDIPSATLIAREIKERIREKTGLTASAGVSYNKFLAKIASDYRKPDGLFVIRPEDAERFVESLEIERFFGVGKVTAKKMHLLGIHNGRDLKNFGEERLVYYFGKVGHAYHENAHAVDSREVNPNRIRKSVGAENTFEADLEASVKMTLELYQIARRVWERIEEDKFYGRTVTLKIKYMDFEIMTRCKTLGSPITTFRTFWDTSKEMLAHVDTSEKKVRLMGLTISHNDDAQLPPGGIQLKIKFKD